MAGNFGLLWLFVALFFVFMCYVWWYLSIIEKTSTSILVFFVLAMTASMFALVLSGLNHIAQNIQPFIQVKSIVSPIDHCGIIGQNPQISSIPSFDPLSDSRHAMVCTHDSRWTIQNLSFHRNLIILRNNITLNPHELPLTKGDSFSINNHKFLISDNFQMPGSMFAKLSVQLPDGKCLNAYRWKTFLISTQGSLRSDAPVIPGQPGQHLAKIYYHSGLHQFVLTWFSSDKSRVQISYNGLNLLNRSINIFNNDTMIIGRTSYQLTISPKNILELHPVKKTYQIPLPETESFIFASTLNMWDSSVQIVLPLQLTEPIHVKSVKNEFNHTLIVNSKNGRNKTLSSGNVFSVRDQYDNLITFSFAGQFFPNSFFNWFINPSPAFQNHTRHIIYVFFFMLILICRLIVSKQLNYWSLPVFMGTLLLTSIGVVFMFRLDVSCRQYANIAIDHIWFIYISLTVLFLTSFSGSLIRKKRKFNLKKAYKKNFQSAFRKEFEHIERDEWTWPIYDSMIEGNWINKPAIVLFFSWIIFLFQWIVGKETGFQIFGINFQPVFLVIVMFAFVLAFGTSSDIVTLEKQVVGGTNFWWRYNDLILCLIFFVPGLMIIKDFAPIFVFFILIFCGWILRTRMTVPSHFNKYNDLRQYLPISVLLVLIVFILYWIVPIILPAMLQNRLATWFAPFQNTINSGQYIDSLWLLKNSGISGFGLGASPEICKLSQVKDDFILSLLLSDLGIVGLLALLISFGLIIFPSLQFSRSNDHSSRFFTSTIPHNIYYYRSLVFWLAMMFIVQIMSIAGMILGLIPVMGIPLPFIGRGGSSLISFAYLSIGIIIFSISEIHYRKN